VYQGGGLPALRHSLYANQESKKQKSFFVRVVNPRNSASALIASVPEDWIGLIQKMCKSATYLSHPAYIRVPKDEERDFTLGKAVMFDGSELLGGPEHEQPGDGVASRFRRIFFRVMTPIILTGIHRRRHFFPIAR